jgi:hypothetical protein
MTFDQELLATRAVRNPPIRIGSEGADHSFSYASSTDTKATGPIGGAHGDCSEIERSSSLDAPHADRSTGPFVPDGAQDARAPRNERLPDSGSGTESVTPLHELSDIQVLGLRAEAAWDVLHKKYAGRISEAEVDYLFACFVYGLTKPSFGEGDPSVHFEICKSLVSLKLPPERAHAALHAVPEPATHSASSAYEWVERKGAEMGLALASQKLNTQARSTVEADTSRLAITEIKRELP